MPRPAILVLPLVLFATAQAAPWRIQARVNAAERLSNTLRSGFEREIADYGWGKLKAGADAKTSVRRLDESLEKLRSEASDKRPLQGRDTVVAVVARARAVDTIFRRHREIAGSSRPRWNRLKVQINALARSFDVASRVRTR